MREKRPNGRTWRTVTSNGRTYEIAPDGTRYAGTAGEVHAAWGDGLKESTRRTVARIARVNGITPAAVIGRIVRGAHLDYFDK